MLAYGRSARVAHSRERRTPTRTFGCATLRAIRANRPKAWIGAFGTIMRLAPTGAPAATGYFAAYPIWSYIQQYANLHDPPLPSEAAAAQALRVKIGEPTLQAYLATRARDLAVDRHLLQLAADGTIDRLALGQDDAGPVGLHVREVTLLQAEVRAAGIAERVAIEPGADELGMAFVAGALARRAHWMPHVGVRYSTPEGAEVSDPLEFAPISNAIDGLIGLCGGVHDDQTPDLELYVRVPATTLDEDAVFAAAMDRDIVSGHAVALADLSYLKSYQDQAAFAQRILQSGLAARLDAYASWNTNANTIGTALSEAIAAGAGRRAHTYDALAHREFTFVRFLDDYAFHDEVRGGLNALLDAQGIHDHTLLTPDVEAPIAQRNRAFLWNQAETILGLLDPGYHIAAIRIVLPWDRTFETQIEVGIAPNV